MWALWPEVLGNYARHVETGEPLPAAVVEAIDAARLWGEGFGTLEYLAATLLDQAWHRIAPDTEIGDPIAFEQQAWRRRGRLRRSSRRATGRRTSSTSSPGATRPGTTPTSGRRSSTPTPWSGSRRTAACAGRTATPSAAGCSSVGGSVDPLAAFRAVRGRDADPGPLLRRRGLATRPDLRAIARRVVRAHCRRCRHRQSRGTTPAMQAGRLTTRGAAAPGRGRRGRRRRAPAGWAGGGRTTVQRCTTCQPLPDFSTSPIGSMGGRHSLARSPGRSSTCSDHRQYGQWLR